MLTQALVRGFEKTPDVKERVQVEYARNQDIQN